MNENTGNHYRRSDVLRSVVERAERSGDGAMPWFGVAGIWEQFPGPGQLLAALHQQWLIASTAWITQAVEHGGGSPADEVRKAYQLAAERHTGLRLILDAHTDHPALAPLIKRERAAVAMMAGLAGPRDGLAQAASAGAALVTGNARPAYDRWFGGRRLAHSRVRVA
jgi:hypothetical protein